MPKTIIFVSGDKIAEQISKLQPSHPDAAIKEETGFKGLSLPGIMDDLQRGDTLVVAQACRLGQTPVDAHKILLTALEKGIKILISDQLVSVPKECIEFFMKLERDFASLRARKAYLTSVAKGLQIGRPKGTRNALQKLDGLEDKIEKWYCEEFREIASMARDLGVTRPTLYRKLDEMGLRNKPASEAAEE